MPSIDERVVSMSFENTRFQAGVAQTMQTLSKLNAELSKTGSANALENIDKEANKVTLSGLASALENVGGKFSILSGAAAVALGNIATQAVSAGARLVKSFTFEPIMAGFQNYETQINAVQTILANTGETGVQGLAKVNGVLGELNTYANQTVYNFAEMAKNIGTFTAAGVDLQTSADSIKGIANLAAMSGSTSQQASMAMYQLSQAIAAGRVSLQDWNSVVNAGMGGKVFQKALWDTAKAMGNITNSPVGQTFEQWEKAGNSFRQSLSQTQKTATSSTGEMAKAQKDAADIVKNAQESAASSVQAAAKTVKDAQKGVADAAQSTADAVSAANDRVVSAEEAVTKTEQESAKAIQTAKDEVKAAHQGVADAAKTSAENIRAAVKAQHEAVKQSAQDVQAALDDVTAARKRLEEAMKPPSQNELQAAQDKVATSQLDQADLADAVARAQEAQTRAAQDLTAAQQKLADAQAAGADPSTIMAAQRAVEDAQQRVKDSADAQERALLQQRAAARDVADATQNLTDVQKKGTDEDRNVIAAKDSLTQALQRYKDAQISARDAVQKAEADVAKTRKDGAAAEVEAQKKLVEAEKNLVTVRQESVQKEKEAAKALVDAQNGVTKARVDGAAKQQEAAARLIQAQQDEVKATKDAQDQIAKAHEAAATRIQAARDKMKPPAPEAPPTWLTSDVLTKTLQQFTGDMSDAKLASMGFTKEQIKAIQAQAQVAVGAATHIKTATQLVQALKEEVATAWSNVFKILFGDINQATTLFSKLHTFIENALTGPINNFASTLKDWAKLGGRKDLLDGIKAAFDDLMSILKPIHDAFREIFPPETAAHLAELTRNFKDFFENLKIGPETADLIKRTFKGVFAVLDIGRAVVGEIIKLFGRLFGVAGKGAGGFLQITAAIGDFLVKVDNALVKGGKLHDVFVAIGTVLAVPIKLIEALASAVMGLFHKDVSGGASKFGEAVKGVADKLEPLKKILDVVVDGWDHLVSWLSTAGGVIPGLLRDLAHVFGTFGNTVADAFKNADYSKVFGAIQTVLIGGIFFTIKKALGGGHGIADLLGVDLSGLNGIMKSLTGNLTALQNNIKANTLLQIALAVGALAAGVIVLSQIDEKALTKALGAVAIGLGELVGALGLLGAVTKGTSGLSMVAMAGSLDLLAAAIVILAGAVTIFSKLSWDELLRGLAGVAGTLVAIGTAMRLMPKGMAATAASLIPLGIALAEIAGAVTIFAKLSWKELLTGLAGVAGSLTAIGLAMKLFGPGVVLIGPGLIGVGIGLSAIAGAVALFGHMDMVTIEKGVIGIAGALVVIGLAIQGMPKTMALQAAGLILVGVALTEISAAIGILGKMKVDTIVKGLAAIGGALAIFAVGLDAMTTGLPGAAALMAVGVALTLLAPAMIILGHLGWDTIIKGLAAMAAIMGTLAVVGLVAAPGLTAIGIALLPLAGALALAAGAAWLFAQGLKSLSDTGVKGVAVMITAITAFIAAVPAMIIGFVKGLVSIIAEMAKLAPKVVDALTTILETLIQVVINAAPRLAIAMGVLIDSLLKVLIDNTPKLLAAGAQLMLDFLRSVDENIPKIIPEVAKLIADFLNELANQLPMVIASAVHMIVSFLGGVASQIGKVIAAGANLVVNFLNGIASQLPKVVASVVNLITTWLAQIAANIPKIIAAGANIIIKFVEGVGSSAAKVVTAAVDTMGRFLMALAKEIPKLADKGAEAVIALLNGIAASIKKYEPQLMQAAWNIAWALVTGFINGLAGMAKKVWDKVKEVFEAPINWVEDKLGIGSPSKLFEYYGRMMGEGLAQGLDRGADAPKNSIKSMVDKVVEAASAIPDALGGSIDFSPTITPVLDLSQVEADSTKLQDLTNVTPITAAASYNQAAAISSEKTASDAAAAAAQPVQAVPSLSFEQNNYSPEALSDIEIYRQTRNQLSQVKSALGLA